jgi:hypothetical protein
MSTEQQMAEQMALVPAGYKFEMLVISYIKRVLQTCEMKAHERLRFLEGLNTFTDSYLGPEVLAMIEPMSDIECEMVHEARSLNREGDKLGSASFDILTSREVFGHFVKLNPSLLAAIEFCHGARRPWKPSQENLQ